VQEFSEADVHSSPYSRPFLFQRAKSDTSLVGHFLKDIQLPSVSPSASVMGSGSRGRKKRGRTVVDVPAPPVLAELAFSWQVFSVGGGTGGFPPHKHTAAWLALVVGRKYWTFLPPGAISAEGLGSQDLYAQAALNAPELWSDELREKLRGKGMRECMQRPGEVIFVPHLWWHATANVGDAIAIGAQADSLWAVPHSDDNIDDHCALSWSQRCMQLEVTATSSMESEPGAASLSSSSVGLSIGSDKETESCDPAASLNDLHRAVQIEPLSIKHIRGYAEGLLRLSHFTTSSNAPTSPSRSPWMPSANTFPTALDVAKHDRLNGQIRDVPVTLPNPFSKALDFLWTVAHLVEDQVKRGNFPLVDAHHLVGRVGIWLDKAPALAQETLSAINSGVGAGGMWMGDKDTVELYQFTLDRFSSLYGKLRLDMEQRIKAEELSKNNTNKNNKRNAK
jgi:hypothetical protein